jgi:hypothetical protein
LKKPKERQPNTAGVSFSASTWLAVILMLASPLQQQADSDEYRDPAIERPPNLAGHKAAGQDVDPLQEPDGAKQHQECAQNGQCDSHVPI